MRTLHINPPRPNTNPPSPSPLPPPPPPSPSWSSPSSPSPPPQSNCCKLTISHCIALVLPTILGLLMVIYLAIPALMPPEFELSRASSLSSPNISNSHVTAQWNIALSVKNPSKLIAVKYSHMMLLLSFGQLALSSPSLISAFTQGPGNETTVRAEALSMLAIVNDLYVEGLVSMLKSRVVTIDVVAKAKRRLHLGPCWVAVLDVYFSCMGVTFTAPTNGKGGRDWMILGGTQSCIPGTFTILW